MNNLDELKIAADEAGHVAQAWQDMLNAVQLSLEAAQHEVARLYATTTTDVDALLDRIGVLETRIATAKKFKAWFAESGLRHEISISRSNAAHAFITAKKQADQAQQHLVDLEFAAQQARAQVDAQVPGNVPQARKATASRVAGQGGANA